MTEYLQNFIDAMTASGCAPHNSADIQATGEDCYYRLLGDRKDKRGGYCLTVTPDGFAYGNFVSFKTGDKGSWFSGKGVKTLTAEERKANEQRQRQLEADRKARTEARHNAAADEAKRLWDSLKPAVDHPYLTAKNVKPHGARIDGEDLIYQGISGGKIWTYQRISPDGSKLYLTGGKKQGCFYPLTTASEPKDIILICEGVSTASSIREACGLPVVAAFDAPNLSPVAKDMRAKYPQARIILCADNDAHGEKNTGILAAQQAAGKVGGHVVWPEFEGGADDTDFNDAARVHGVEYVKNKILAVVDSARAAGSILRHPPDVVDVQAPSGDYHPPTEADLDLNLIPMDAPTESGKLSPVFDDHKLVQSLLWKKWPSDSDRGKMEPNSLENILIFMRHKPKYQGIFRFDRFAGRVIVHKEPFWHTGEKFKVRELRDTDISYMTASMERDGLAPTAAKVYEAVNVVAGENWIDPPVEYLDKIIWDKQPRHDKWLKKAMGATGDDEYLAAVGGCVLIAIVARQYDPGCKAENMLVFEGGQGVFKSTSLSILANVGQGKDAESYFCDTLSFNQIEDKDTVLKLKGKMIVEFPDLAGMSNREVEAIKAWMSVQTDEIRVPYGREMMKFKRRFIPFGSTNQSHWLVDQTGNRRFWPVKCGKIDIQWLMDNKEQLLAEAVYKYKNKGIWWIPRDSQLLVKAQAEQSMRLLEDIWHEPVERFLTGINFITVSEILQHLKVETKDQNSRQQKQVIGILKQLNFEPKAKWTNGKSVRGWQRISAVQEILEPEYTELEF